MTVPAGFSMLYTAACLTSAITPWLWMPEMSAAAIWPDRYGSSPNVSNARPQRGSRTMLTVGPSATLAPLPANSAPIAAPYCCSYEGSKVAAEALPDGIWVTPPRPSPTPAGPSCRPRFGMHSDGMPVRLPMYGEALPLPCSREIFWASVIWAMTSDTRVATRRGGVHPRAGAVAAGAPAAAGRVDAELPQRVAVLGGARGAVHADVAAGPRHRQGLRAAGSGGGGVDRGPGGAVG